MSGKPTITPEWRVPLYVVGSTVALAVLMTSQWLDLRAKVEAATTTQQAQEWIDNARELNPNMKWPRLPDKRTDKGAPVDHVAVVSEPRTKTESQ